MNISYHYRGETHLLPGMGDVILHTRDTRLGKLIKWFQRLGHPSKYAEWTHASLAISPDGYIQEALEWGLEVEHIDKYDFEVYAVIHTGEEMSDEELFHVLDFARSVRSAYQKQNYGYVKIASILLNLLTSTSFRFGVSGTMICSGFVCEALRGAGYIWPIEAPDMKPADIAEYFDVRLSKR